MRRYLLDSNTLNLLIHRKQPVNNRARTVRKAGEVVGTAIPVVAEMLAGIEISSTRDRNRDIFDREIEALYLWPFDRPAARYYAEIFAALRRQGVVMQVIDLQLAAVAKTIPNCTVVSCDGDFKRVPGLSVEDWTV